MFEKRVLKSQSKENLIQEEIYIKNMTQNKMRFENYLMIKQILNSMKNNLTIVKKS